MTTLNPFAIVRAILPAPIVGLLDKLAAKLQPLLEGEPIRAITYGAIALVWIVSRAMVLLGFLPLPPSIDAIVIAVTAAITAITAVIAEFARRWAYSPATVEQLKADHAEDLEVAARAAINAIANAKAAPASSSTQTISATELVAAPSDGEGPVDESQKGAELPEGDGVELEPDEDLPAPADTDA